MAGSKYQYGDNVKVNGARAKITSVWSNHTGDWCCRVRFDDGSEAEYPENHVHPLINRNFSGTKPPTSYKPQTTVYPPVIGSRFIQKPNDYGDIGRGFKKIDNDKTCPLCGDEWHWIPSPFRGMKEIWYDCTRCNLSRKDIKKQLENQDEF